MSHQIAALVPNLPGHAPGQRARIELWANHLETAGWSVDFYSFEDARLHEVLYSPGHKAQKASAIASCYARHLARVVKGISADVMFVYREAALLGPALGERLVNRPHVPLVYDLDDPTWLPYRSPTNGWLSLLKFPGKTRSLFRLADHVIAINGAIADYAARFNPNVTVVPNCIDTDRYYPRPPPKTPPVRLAWIGSHSTASNLATVAGPLRRLQATAPVVVRIIGAEHVPLDGVPLEFRRWSADTEVELLAECHVGLVPLNDAAWNPWKFFFKTIQYMALGLPVVARRLGSNVEVIEDGVNGFLVETETEWIDRLRLLTTDPGLLRQMGEAARSTVESRFSVRSQIPRLLSTFEALSNRRSEPVA